MNVMVYGWASMAGMGTAIWLMARLCRTVLRHPLLLVAGAGFWNLGVLLGVGGILLGDSAGYQWLEFPHYAAIVLFVAYTLVISWAVLMFRFRRGEQIYITQWYLLGAFLWFPWLYATGQLMLFVVPVQGVLQAAVGWWYANNLLFLCFGAIGLHALMLRARGVLEGTHREEPSLELSETRDTVVASLRGRSLSGLLLTASHFISPYHFELVLLGLGRPSTVSTFVSPVEAER